MTIEGQKIHIIKYAYNSSSNTVTFDGDFYYSCGFTPKEYLSCELMKYLGNKVIFCFYGEWNGLYYTVFETTNFEAIGNHSGIISNIGGILFRTSVNSTSRENVVCCTQHFSELRCYGYNIKTNEFIGPGNINDQQNGNCEQVQIDIQLEYFPETNEFLIGCKQNVNSYFIGKFKPDNTFNIIGKIENTIPEDYSFSCNQINLYHFVYNSGKYSILTDSPYCQNERIVNLGNEYQSVQIREYPTDEIGVEITPTCNGYLTYDTSECVPSLIDGYFYNDSSQNIIYPYHRNCKTCVKEGTDDNNNCLKCLEEDTKYLDFRKLYN